MSKYESRLFIDGNLVDAKSGKTYDLLNPATNEFLAKIPIALREDVDAAVEAAGKAQPQWAALPAHIRGDVLRKFSNLMAENVSKLAELDSICMGKPVGTHRADVEEACKITNFFSGLVETASGQTSLNTPHHMDLSLRQPFGVVAAIVAWNFPTLLWVHEISAACGAGNAMILKTSEKSPLSGILLAQLATKAGFPPGIVNIVSGAAETGELLSSHMKIRKISFTGSTRAGRAVMQAAARSNLKNVALELGGKSPLIVFDDANLDWAAADAVNSITLNSGQVCTSSSRAYVQKGAAATFKKLLISYMSKLKMGEPSAASTQLGPQADARQAASVKNYIAIGKQSGHVLHGGGQVDCGVNFVQPTIFTDVADTSRLNVEEIFGPVLVLHEFETEVEVIKRANDTEYGLYSSVYSSNINTALRVASALEAGNVGVNCTSPYGAYDLPFGGFKASGIGRQKGSNAIQSWLEEKSVFIRQEVA
ncbi:aldehyde dehydrogenase family protein [Aspergillus tanneri]|uniref:aldehyde dehydrogenase (NAD(+)) n=1 Tax=Aspergillus tanneri TaxID=1220188 RepID=A0A5M9MN08_9EURO|nr:uncharacterized protein ATNIH1004_005365 [Aspergillus tanneri]KAA8646690.1 hypothetical protein ATNIH1004_005365 [Aspergillus tanneri]